MQVLIKEQPSLCQLRIFLQIPQNIVYEKFYVHEKNLRTQNCRRKFTKNLLPEKRKENM